MIVPAIVAAALWALAAGLVLSVVLGAAAAGAIAWSRPRAATRQALWSVALGAAGFAPVVILAVMLLRATQPTAPPVAVITAPAGAQPAATGAQRAAAGAVSSGAALPARGANAGRRLALPAPPDLAAPVAAGITFIWGAGALIGLIELGRSLVRVRGLKARSSPLDGELATELPWLTTTAGREIYLRLSYETEAPIAIGFRRPVILLPTEMATADGLTSIEALIMHEYAHLTRYDDWTNLAQRAIERVFWFNPVVWMLGRRIALEREVAADEAVVARTHDAKRYASTLWRMAQEMRMPEHVVVAPGAMLTRKQISVRIERLVEEAPARRGLRAAVLVMTMLAVTGVAALAAGAPPVVLVQTAPAPAIVAPPHPPVAPSVDDLAQHIQADVERKVSAAVTGKTVQVAATADGTLSRDLIKQCIGCDFSGRDLRGIDLSNVSLVGDDFDRAKLSGANFSGSSLQGDSFVHADLNHVNLHKAKVMGADFSWANLDGADLSDASLTGADLSRASLDGANTTGIHLIGSSLP